MLNNLIFYMKYLVLFIIIIFCSCAKDTVNPIRKVSDEKLAKMNAFMKGAVEIDYKHDFRVRYFNEAVPPKVAPLLQERELIQYASASPEAMLEKYPKVKSTISDWLNQNENDRYSWAIQNTSLKYLRRLFLTENQPSSVAEVSFLLKTLIGTKSIDLDVLADAFHYCKESLSSSEQDSYFNYIKNLHDDEIKYMTTNFAKFKEKYENSTGPTKMKYLGYGKGLERRSKACFHTRELLGIDIIPSD